MSDAPLDANGDGHVSVREAGALLQSSGLPLTLALFAGLAAAFVAAQLAIGAEHGALKKLIFHRQGIAAGTDSWLTTARSMTPGSADTLLSLTDAANLALGFGLICTLEILLRQVLMAAVRAADSTATGVDDLVARGLLALFPEVSGSESAASLREQSPSKGSSRSLFRGKPAEVLHMRLSGVEGALLWVASRSVCVLFACLAAFDLSDEGASTVGQLLKAALIVRMFTPLQAESAVFVHELMESMHASDDPRAKSTATLLSLTTRVALIAMAVTLAASEFGYDTTAAVTGMGVGGIAVGFALQQTVSDTFSCLLILMARPFNVGDFVDLGGGVMGTVRAINFRSTTIAKLDCGHTVYVPNAELVKTRIANYAGLQQRRMNISFTLSARTPVEKLRLLRRLAEGRVKAQGCTLVFMNFNEVVEYGLQYQMCFLGDGQALVVKQQREDIFHGLLEDFRKQGITLATPASEFRKFAGE